MDRQGIRRGWHAVGEWFFAAAIVARLGCAVDSRPGQIITPLATDTSGGAAGDGPGPVGGGGTDGGIGGAAGDAPANVPGVLGVSCDNGAECATGNCVDGVCCDTPCVELCAVCNTPGSLGTCGPTASEPLCPPVACPGTSTECYPIDDSGLALNCASFGVCRTDGECAAEPAVAGTPCRGDTGTCDGAGACQVPGKASLSEACTLDDDCAEGHCVATADGATLCCNAACDGVCQACSAAGRCEETPATDARCESISCPTDNACRNYVDALTENLCRGFGTCRGALDCLSAENYLSLRPAAQCVCDPVAGNCSLAAAVSCTEGAECASGACLPTAQGIAICCAVACADGLFCRADGTACAQCEGAQLDCDGDVQLSCSNGTVITTNCPNGCTPSVGCNTEPTIGRACEAGRCAAPAVCQPDIDGQARCCVRDCAAEGKVCAVSGSCECAPGQAAEGDSCLLLAGDPCRSASECESGSCVDGVCCQEACDGSCERCEGGSGLCLAVPAGQEVDGSRSCNNGFECTGERGDCRARTGQSCSSSDGADCLSGSCQPTVGGGARVCCSEACAGVRASCRGNGQGCVECESGSQCGNGCNVAQGLCNPLRQLGETCTVGGQCSSTRCVADVDDGSISRCCGTCAPGQRCNAQGACVQPPAGLGGPCSDDTDCASGSCAPEGICCDAACDDVCEACNASGRCLATASDAACNPVPCDTLGVGCQTSTRLTSNLCRGRGECKDTSDCVFDDVDDGTACATQVSTFDVCQDGACVDPPVVCGQATCSVDPNNTCCFRGQELGESAGYRCEQRPVCGNSGIFEPIQFIDCDSPDDCRPGTVCCIDFSVGARFANLTCKPTADCNIDDFGQFRFAQLCGSLSFSDPGACPAGRPCLGTGDDSVMPGFSFCGPP